mmetsp:Transcript_15305/g.11123  ORF Transcript_15305/g.11123 Transcript_15305/m.11123 type:complete len:99 (-) Transcript_15305:374-670(-)
MDFMGAGTITSSTLLSNMIIHSIQNPDKIAKLREELDEKLFRPNGIKMGSEDGFEKLASVISYDKITSLPYLGYYVYETLRNTPSVVMSTPGVFTSDI